MQAITPNIGQERTGTRGSIDPGSKDIYCPDQGSPDYNGDKQKNYYSTSCAERQALKSCNNSKCERFKGEAPDPKTYRLATSGGAAEGKRLIICADCGREMPHAARGLCGRCHKANTKAGTIKQYGSARK